VDGRPSGDLADEAREKLLHQHGLLPVSFRQGRKRSFQPTNVGNPRGLFIAMNRIEALRWPATLALAALSLSSCMIPVMPPLPSGTRSGMGEERTRIRSQLAITAVSLAERLTYRPVQACSYRVKMGSADGEWSEGIQQVSLRRVRDRLLITAVQGGNTSTALIGNDGQVHDFNVSLVDGERTNSEVFFGGAHGDRDAMAINPINLAFPHYVSPRLGVGEMTGFVQHQSGWPWARYVYRGTTTYRGVDAIVLDLLSQVENDGRGQPLTIGFAVIDRRNSMPLYYTVDAGFTVEALQISCR